MLTLTLALAALASDPKPVRVLLVVGGCCHDYAQQKDVLVRGLSARVRSTWVTVYDTDTGTKHPNPVYDKLDWAAGFDVVVHDECSSDVTDPKLVARILKPHRDGLPGVVLHCGVHSYRTAGWPGKTTPWVEFVGLHSTGHGPQAPIAVTYPDPASPITRGLSGWKTIDEELYNNASGKLLDTARPLARGSQVVRGRDGKEQTADAVVAWTNTFGAKTRVFSTTLGHNTATVADDRYLDLVARGLLWAVDRPDAALDRSPKP